MCHGLASYCLGGIQYRAVGWLTASVIDRANHTLSEEQISWIEVSENTVRQLIVETPPNGDKFSSIVKVWIDCSRLFALI